MVTLGGARPKVMVVPELVALVSNLWLDTLVTIRLEPSVSVTFGALGAL